MAKKFKYEHCENEAWVIKFLRNNPQVEIISITNISNASLGHSENYFIIFYKEDLK